MSTITSTLRSLMAVLQPATGTRADGTVVVTASGGDVTVPCSSYAIPIIGGAHRPDLVVKTAAGPNADDSWTVESGGTNVDFVSNIGGARHILANATALVFDPEISGIASLVAANDWANGADPTEFGSVVDMTIVERFEGPVAAVDLRRSNIKGFPCVILAWQDSEPADGSTISQTDRATRTGTRKTLYKESFRVSIVSVRADSPDVRREEGLLMLDELSGLLTDRQEVDGVKFSNPSGLQIRRRWRENGPQKFYQRHFVYNILISAEVLLQQTDARTYVNLENVVFDVVKPQEPALPNQGDLTVVDDVKVDMTP